MAGTRSWRAQHRYGDMELFTCDSISCLADTGHLYQGILRVCGNVPVQGVTLPWHVEGVQGVPLPGHVEGLWAMSEGGVYTCVPGHVSWVSAPSL